MIDRLSLFHGFPVPSLLLGDLEPPSFSTIPMSAAFSRLTPIVPGIRLLESDVFPFSRFSLFRAAFPGCLIDPPF